MRVMAKKYYNTNKKVLARTPSKIKRALKKGSTKKSRAAGKTDARRAVAGLEVGASRTRHGNVRYL